MHVMIPNPCSARTVTAERDLLLLHLTVDGTLVSKDIMIFAGHRFYLHLVNQS